MPNRSIDTEMKGCKRKDKSNEKKHVNPIIVCISPEIRKQKNNAPFKPSRKVDMGGKSITLPFAAAVELRPSMKDELD